MGYYGLGPGMKVADQLTPLEKTLRAIPVEMSAQTFDVLETICKNIAQNPSEQKFRKIKLGNAKISKCITTVHASVEALMIIGFEYQEEDDCLVLPLGIRLSFPDHVTKIMDTRDFFRKENEKLRVSKGMGRVAPANEPKAEDPRSEEEIKGLHDRTINWCRKVRKIDASQLA